MHAIISSGGKQYRVAPGQTIQLEKLPHTVVGQPITFEHVLLLSDGTEKVTMGTPFIPNAKVMAEVVDQGRHDKVHIIKMRRRKHYMRRQGHRQHYTEVKITEISI